MDRILGGSSLDGVDRSEDILQLVMVLERTGNCSDNMPKKVYGMHTVDV